MADSYVCSGATMKCTMGTSTARLTVLPIRTVFLTGQPMANISDHLSMVNLAPFGRCRSLGFPATAAATAAHHGHLTPMPCMHNTPFPWMNGKNDYIVKGDPALLKSSTCQCMWGGTISLITDGQTPTAPADLSKRPQDTYNQKESQFKSLTSAGGKSSGKKKTLNKNDQNNHRFVLQFLKKDCAIKSQQLILPLYGVFINGNSIEVEAKLIKLATSMRNFNNNTTSRELGQVLKKIFEAKGKQLPDDLLEKYSTKSDEGIYPNLDSLKNISEILGMDEYDLKIEIAYITNQEIFKRTPNTLDTLPRNDLEKFFDIYGYTDPLDSLSEDQKNEIIFKKFSEENYSIMDNINRMLPNVNSTDLEKLNALANERWYGWKEGTRGFAAKNILEWADIEAESDQFDFQRVDAAKDLEDLLMNNYHIIAFIDNKELWSGGVDYATNVSDFRSPPNFNNPNHFIVIESINRKKNIITITDPGKGEYRKEYELDTFFNAWEDSNYFMVRTIEASSYVQNPSSANKYCKNDNKKSCTIIPLN